MAKKKETLSLEEKLQQALVPDWEQPYKVPENWCWTRLGNIVRVSSGKSLTIKNMEITGDIPVYGGNGITGIHNDFNIEGENVIIGRVGFYCGSVHFIRHRAWITDNALICSYYRSKLNSKYLFWLLNDLGLGKYNASSAQPVISGTKIYPISVPLPPLAEQHRIVTRIESLFAKLDEAKELAQSALDSFENRKAAILHQAFTGELTKKWREEHGVGIESWEEFSLQKVCTEKITDGTHQTPTYSDKENGIPFVSSKDVTTGKIGWSKIKYITKELHEVLYKRVAPQIDDVLLAKNGTTGVAALVEDDLVFDLYVTLALLRPNKEVITPKYLYNIVNSPICKEQFDAHLTGIGVPNLHLRDIREVIIPVPTLPEQTEIVRILDTLFAKETQAKELTNVITQIDLMKKAILARAFRGELGTNVAEDESAVELLREILEGE
ncbi:restriction endonuclease subunit S [Bengtsoniella intestinalis]|uniref:restriction endonuclease subunit S n=1 Tax=Bengtsoniella intestinalis TaxID=3073143 RepID=UPI00391F6CC8